MAVETLTVDEFEALPSNKPGSANDEFWESVVSALSEARIVKISVSEQERMGRRMALTRRTTKAGLKVEIRYGDGFIAARRVSD